jgi:predicted nucleic acid-binding protein
VITATLDASALIAIERRKPRGVMLLRAASEYRVRLFVATPTITEWWRGRTDVRDRIIEAVVVVPFPAVAAKAAGDALGHVQGENARAQLAIDAMVMAFAATVGGGLVYTSDVDDLSRLTRHFPDVRVLGV